MSRRILPTYAHRAHLSGTPEVPVVDAVSEVVWISPACDALVNPSRTGPQPCQGGGGDVAHGETNAGRCTHED